MTLTGQWSTQLLELYERFSEDKLIIRSFPQSSSNTAADPSNFGVRRNLQAVRTVSRLSSVQTRDGD